MVVYFVYLQNVQEVWTMVKHMTEVPIVLQGSVLKSRTSPETHSAVVKQAQKYLETR